jgi:muramidase (phage lysozyme)
MTDSFKSPIFKAPPVRIRTKKFFTDIEPGKQQEVLGKLDELIAVIREDNKLEKQEQKVEKRQKQEEKRTRRENRIESNKFLRSTSSKLNKTFFGTGGLQNIFDTIIKFLVFTGLGQLVKFVGDFLGDPKNKNTIRNIQDFFREIPGKIESIVEWASGTIEKVKQFAESFRQLLARFPFLGQYFKTKEEKAATSPPEERLFTNPTGAGQVPSFKAFYSGGGMLSMGTDTVPAMLTPGEFIMSRGAVNKFGVDFMESVNAMGGGTNRPKFGRVAYAAGGGLLDFIGSGEGTYESMNQGTNKDGKIVGSALDSTSKLGKKLTDMTIGEIRQRQRYIMDYSNPQVGDYGIFAAGKYQIIPPNMDAALRGTGLTDKDMFSPANQDIMGMNLLMNKAGREKLSAYLRGKSNDIIGAQTQLAQEFASVPVPIDMMGAYGPVKAGQSYYAGDGNRAGHSVAETRAALEKERKTNLSSRTGPKTKVSSAPPVVSGIGPMMGPAFGDDTTAYTQAARTELGKLGRFIFDATGARNLFHMIKDKLPVGTPNIPTTNEFIVLPTIKADNQTVSPPPPIREIPEFDIISGVNMRELVGKSLGIDDLVS